MISGMRSVMRWALRRQASSRVLPLSGSQWPSDDTAVRSTSMGVAACGNMRRIITVSTGIFIEPLKPSRKARNSTTPGNRPNQSR